MFNNINNTGANDATSHYESRRPVTRSCTRKHLSNEKIKPFNKIINNEKPTNIISILNKAQLYASTPRYVLNLPNKFIDVISERMPVADFIHLLKRLDQSSVVINCNDINDVIDLIRILRDIENRLMHFNVQNNTTITINQPQDEFEVELINIEAARVFRLYGGVEIIKRILLLSLIFNEPNKKSAAESDNMLKIKCKCMQILNRLICLPNYGKQLVQDLLKDGDTIIQYLFTLLLGKETRLQACQLLESILLHIPLYNLRNIKKFEELVRGIDNDGLACMCKIFAVTLSDLDSNDNKYWVSHQRKQKAVTLEAHIIRDSNHDLLSSMKFLLGRLVGLVRRKDYAIRYPNAQNELQNWMQFIDEALSDDDLDSDVNNANSNDSYSNGAIVNNNSNSNNMNSSNINDMNFIDDIILQPALLAAAKLNNFVHVLYTLSLLLIGKERKLIQKNLTKLKLASALDSLFDFLIWNCRCEYPQENLPNQMRSHLCPEVAVKIQFLRLVHSFCDNSEFKRVVLSENELQEILAYNNEALPILKCAESSLKVNIKLICTNKKVGLLSKIVEVIKQEPFSASFRFWLTRAIESFLRGVTSYADQLFLIKRGIVEDTVRNILETNFTRPKEVLQSCFDMLAELIKLNSIGFTILNKELENQEKFDLFLRMINHSLVDSNMFLRSIFLSVEFFQAEGSQLNFQLADNAILTYFDDFDRRIRYVCRMINTINIHNLSQENISCLNTTLVVLMLANKKDQLPKYLKAIKAKSIEMVITNELNNLNAIQDPFCNFKDLLLFWQSHYLQKDKDCAGLEQNSRIEFKYWKTTVELLLNTDASNQCSLNYYFESHVTYISNTNNIEELRSD